MPRRKAVYRRVTPLASRRETQRRAAIAALALITVVGGLGLAVYTLGGPSKQLAISSVNAGQAALELATADLAQVSGPGIDLVESDPEEALRLLTEAYAELKKAEAAKVSARVVTPLRAEVVTLLDRLYEVVPVTSTELFRFNPEEGAAPFDLTAIVRGPDDAPYVMDATTQSVYRIDLARMKATARVSAGQ